MKRGQLFAFLFLFSTAIAAGAENAASNNATSSATPGLNSRLHADICPTGDFAGQTGFWIRAGRQTATATILLKNADPPLTFPY